MTTPRRCGVPSTLSAGNSQPHHWRATRVSCAMTKRRTWRVGNKLHARKQHDSTPSLREPPAGTCVSCGSRCRLRTNRRAARRRGWLRAVIKLHHSLRQVRRRLHVRLSCSRGVHARTVVAVSSGGCIELVRFASQTDRLRAKHARSCVKRTRRMMLLFPERRHRGESDNFEFFLILYRTYAFHASDARRPM